MKLSLRLVRIIIVACLVAFVISGLTWADNSPKTNTAVTYAPNFSLPDINGRHVSLNNVISRNKVTVLNFWAIRCPPCRHEIPELIDFYNKFKYKQVEILAVNIEEAPAVVAKFAGDNGMNFPVLTDPAGSQARVYQIYYIPTTFIVDRQGAIRYATRGGTDAASLTAVVNEILKEY